MAIHLTSSQALNIQNNPELMSRLAHADIIAVVRGSGGKPVALWARPQAEVAARVLPADVDVLTFHVDDERAVAALQSAVDRLKNGD